VQIADLNQAFHDRIRKENQPGKRVLTKDGVHMNDLGNQLMAEGLLRALGCGDAEIAKARTTWEPLIAESIAAAKQAWKDREAKRASQNAQ
jgi:hypothetical protein